MVEHHGAMPARAYVGTMLAVGVALVALLTGCDPCSGVLSCAPGPYLAIDGRMVEPAHGFSLPGVRIDVVRTGGIELGVDSLSTVSDEDGMWRVELSPRDVGTAFVDIEVTPPDAPPYRLHDVALVTRDHRGDANFNERWVTYLSIPAYGEFYVNGGGDERAAGARVQFRRTGGIPWSGPGVHDDVWTGTTDAGGHVPLFPRSGPNAVIFTDGGSLVGELTITTANGAGTMTVRNVSLGTTNVYHDRSFLPPILRLPVPASGRDSLTLGS